MTRDRNAWVSLFVAAICLAAILASPEPARAELQRVEAVGIYGIRDSMRKRVIPRDEAISMARWEGVSRVALELIGESAPHEAFEGPSGTSARRPSDESVMPSIDSPQGAKGRVTIDDEDPSVDLEAALRKALGDDVLPYMRGYRIIEDRGEVPVLFNDAPDVSVEYVVVVEVVVDVDRVTRALEVAGLIDPVGRAEIREAIVVELVGLSRYEALEWIVGALRDQLGARSVQTIEFSRQRQVLLVEGPFGPAQLANQLARFENPRLFLEATGVDAVGRRIRLTGRWLPETDGSKGASRS